MELAVAEEPSGEHAPEPRDEAGEESLPTQEELLAHIRSQPGVAPIKAE